uniref:Uncharacterized protein n=1 Tax=Aegilops tauschii TaxID=37682 RepID=N1QVX6_AEGTA
MAVARVSSLDLERAMAVHVRGGGERPYGAAHIDREKLEPQRVHGAIAVTAGGAWAAETSGSVQPSRRRPATLEKKTMATGGLYEQGSPGPASSTNSQLQTITQVNSPSITNPFYNCSPFLGIPEAEYRCRVYANNKIYATTLFSTSMVSSFRDSKSDDKRFYIFSPTKALKLKTCSKDDRVSVVEALVLVRSVYSLRLLSGRITLVHSDISILTARNQNRMHQEALNESLIQD